MVVSLLEEEKFLESYLSNWDERAVRIEQCFDPSFLSPNQISHFKTIISNLTDESFENEFGGAFVDIGTLFDQRLMRAKLSESEISSSEIEEICKKENDLIDYCSKTNPNLLATIWHYKRLDAVYVHIPNFEFFDNAFYQIGEIRRGIRENLDGWAKQAMIEEWRQRRKQHLEEKVSVLSKVGENRMFGPLQLHTLKYRVNGEEIEGNYYYDFSQDTPQKLQIIARPVK